MPKYLLQYRVETCLTSKANIDLSFEGHKSTFLFGQMHANDTTVLVQMELDSANNRNAQSLAASFLLPQILDSLSFSTGTPLLLESFNDAKGYGFLSTDEGKDVFVHFSAINSKGHKSLTEGDVVEFVVEKGPKGLKASEVSVLERANQG